MRSSPPESPAQKRPPLHPAAAAALREAIAAKKRAREPRPSLRAWCREHRQMPGSAIASRWREENAPHAMEPMDALSDRGVQQVTVIAPTQLLKSELCINAALHTALCGDAMLLVEPDQMLAAEFIQDRIRPAVQSVDRAAVEPVAADQAGLLKQKDRAFALRLAGGGSITAVTPGQKTGLASRPVRAVVIDEIDRMDNPAAVVQGARSRLTTFGRDGKLLVASTPTSKEAGMIWTQWEEGSRGTWFGKCVHCGELSSMDFGRVLFDKTEEGLWKPETAVMSCSSCGAVWNDAERVATSAAGAYVHQRPDSPHQSYRVPGLAHLWRSLQQIVTAGAVAWREGRRHGQWEAWKQFVNDYLAEPYDGEAERLDVGRLVENVYDMSLPEGDESDARGVLDPRVQMVTAGMDVGAHALYAQAAGWGWDAERKRVLCFPLEYVLFGDAVTDDIDSPDLWAKAEAWVTGARWRHPLNEKALVPIQRAFVDCRFRPDLVRPWCAALYKRERVKRRTPFGARVMPSASVSVVASGKGLVELPPSNRKPGRWGSMYPRAVDLSSGALKFALYNTVETDVHRVDGRQFIFPADAAERGLDATYMDGLASERPVRYKTPQGKLAVRWDKVSSDAYNEPLDCLVYSRGAAELVAIGGGKYKSLSLWLAAKHRRRGVHSAPS